MSRYVPIEFFIDGHWQDASDHLPILNPCNEAEIGRLPIATKANLDDALQAAEHGFRVWSRTAPMERTRIINKASSLMRDRQEEIAISIALELGKPIRQARLEVIRGCEFFEWEAGEGQRLYGHVIPSAPGIRYVVHRQPIGCVAAFSPWNFPMSQPARKVASALAAGCSIILKPAEETPAGAVHIARAFADAGLPPGVLNIVFGHPAEISSHLISKAQIRLAAFTGSTAVGRQLTQLATQHMTPVLMELGGHAPVIVCDDVDAGKVGATSAVRKYRNAGQVCTSPTRFFVHDTQYESFTQSFLDCADGIRVGDALDESTDMGPVAHGRRLDVLQGLVDDAVSRGARLLAGGTRTDGKGYFFPPTVLADVPDEALILQEEPFGPIAVINPIDSLEQGIRKANNVAYGLAAYAFTHSAANVDRLTDGIEAGNLSINTLEASVAETPFGGVKCSGYGREGGDEGLANYTVVKTVSHSMDIV